MTLQSEFDALQSEIDRICSATQYNTKNIFSVHEPDYYQMEGNRQWNQGTGKDGVTGITIGAVSDNAGYEDLYVGKNVTTNKVTVEDTGTLTEHATITTNTEVKESVTIDSTNNTFKVTINGTEQTVTLAEGKRTRKDLLEEINAQLEENTSTFDYTFSDIDVCGKTVTNTASLREC